MHFPITLAFAALALALAHMVVEFQHSAAVADVPIDETRKARNGE